jgi:hypothetical protein
VADEGLADDGGPEAGEACADGWPRHLPQLLVLLQQPPPSPPLPALAPSSLPPVLHGRGCTKVLLDQLGIEETD